jgi:hypothetical protein
MVVPCARSIAFRIDAALKSNVNGCEFRRSAPQRQVEKWCSSHCDSASECLFGNSLSEIGDKNTVVLHGLFFAKVKNGSYANHWFIYETDGDCSGWGPLTIKDAITVQQK